MIGFADMTSDTLLSDYAFPVSPFMVSETTTDKPGHIMVHYFHTREPTSVPGDKVYRLADGTYSKKTVVYKKYWQDVNFGIYKQMFNNKGRAGKKKKHIPDEYFKSNWKAEELDKRFVLPLLAPLGLLPNPVRGEQIILRMEFIFDQLLPACRLRKIIT